MKLIKYGNEFPPLSDYEVVSLLDKFCKDVDIIETSNFLVVVGARAMIRQGDLHHEQVEFHFTEVEEIRTCDKNGKMKDHPRIYGEELHDTFLDTILGI